MKNFHKKYRNSFNKTKMYDKRLVWKETEDLVKGIKSPWKKKRRGRPPRYKSQLYATILIWMSYFDLTLRETQADLLVLLGSSPDFRSIDWALLNKMPQKYLQMAIQRLYEKIYRKLCSEKAYYIGDGTGYSHKRLDQMIKKYAFKAGRWDYYQLKIRGHSKAAVIARYFPRQHILPVCYVQPGKGYYSDVKLFNDMWDNVKISRGTMIWDPALDSVKAIEKLFKADIKPCIKPKQLWGIESKIRRKAKRLFRKEIYRLRGIVESIFGATKTRYGSNLRPRRTASRFNPVPHGTGLKRGDFIITLITAI